MSMCRLMVGGRSEIERDFENPSNFQAGPNPPHRLPIMGGHTYELFSIMHESGIRVDIEQREPRTLFNSLIPTARLLARDRS